jgi:hypothetical protein
MRLHAGEDRGKKKKGAIAGALPHFRPIDE